MTEETTRPDIYELIKEAVKDGLAIVRQFEESGKLIYRYYDFPKMSQLPSGLPSFHKLFVDDDAPQNWQSIFGRKEYLPETIPSWQRFWDFAHKDESLSRFWGIGSYTEEKWYSERVFTYGFYDALD